MVDGSFQPSLTAFYCPFTHSTTESDMSPGMSEKVWTYLEAGQKRVEEGSGGQESMRTK